MLTLIEIVLLFGSASAACVLVGHITSVLPFPDSTEHYNDNALR